MTDFENRLRAAVQSSVSAEQPPPELLTQVRRRHRHHLARLGALGLAVATLAALAASPARSALLNGHTPRPSASASVPSGQVYGCDAQTYGTLKAVPLIVLVADNATVSVAPVPADLPYLRFLPGFNSNDEYTPHDGLPTATFAACPDSSAWFGGGLTEYYIGVTVDGPRRITLDVRSTASQATEHAPLQFGACRNVSAAG